LTGALGAGQVGRGSGCTTEDGETTVSFGNIIDELLDQHGLADTGTTEKADFSTMSIWGKQDWFQGPQQ
jgi:hypothetical protein